MKTRSVLAGAILLLAASHVSATETFIYSGGWQTYNVPITGSYTITAAAAQGGSTATAPGGLGARVSGIVSLTAGDVLDIAVGGMGQNAVGYMGSHPGAGGGGATWVADNLFDTLVVAGGGGGAGSGLRYSDGEASGVVNGNGRDGGELDTGSGSGGAAGRGFVVSPGQPTDGGGGGGAGLFGGGGDGALGGGQGGGQGVYPAYINSGIAPGGGPSSYGGYGGGGGGDAYGSGGGGGGFTGGDGGRAWQTANLNAGDPDYAGAYVGPYGVGGWGGTSAFLGDTLIDECTGCRAGYGFVTLTYDIPTGPGGGYAGPGLPGGVPEPSTWALMLIGLGVIGGVSRSEASRRSGSPIPPRPTVETLA